MRLTRRNRLYEGCSECGSKRRMGRRLDEEELDLGGEEFGSDEEEILDEDEDLDMDDDLMLESEEDDIDLDEDDDIDLDEDDDDMIMESLRRNRRRRFYENEQLPPPPSAISMDGEILEPVYVWEDDAGNFMCFVLKDKKDKERVKQCINWYCIRKADGLDDDADANMFAAAECAKDVFTLESLDQLDRHHYYIVNREILEEPWTKDYPDWALEEWGLELH